MNEIAALTQRIVRETEKIIVGQEEKIRLLIMAVLADGHVLLDDLPGVGKTTLVKTLSRALGCQSRRVQFVPDLLPADICGMKIYNQKLGDFQTIPGPVMTNLLLADEINRAIPRTQSALLEAMEERQVTVDGETYPLPRPFLVLATQNPVESESTFRLPAAQMDRFLICLSMGYPGAEEEVQMLIGILAIISLVIRAETLCVSPISAARSILGMEGSVAFFLFFLFYLTIKDLEMRLCLPLLAASLLSLYAILFQRLAGVRGDARRHSRLLVFLPLLLLVFTVAAALAFLRFGADALAGGTLQMYHALLAVLLFLGRALLRFLQWLAALFPAAEAGGVLPEPLETAMGEMDLTLPDSDPRLLMVAVVLVLLVVLGIGIYVVYRLRRVRFGQRRVVGASAVTRQRPTLGRWLRRVLAHITFSLTLLARYQTPQALYYRLLRAGQALGRPRRPGETPCAYVRRMADCAGENTALPAAMEALELALQEALYAPRTEHPLTPEEVRVLRRGWRRLLWAARLRRGLGLFTRPRAKAVRQPQPPQ